MTRSFLILTAAAALAFPAAAQVGGIVGGVTQDLRVGPVQSTTRGAADVRLDQRAVEARTRREAESRASARARSQANVNSGLGVDAGVGVNADVRARGGHADNWDGRSWGYASARLHSGMAVRDSTGADLGVITRVQYADDGSVRRVWVRTNENGRVRTRTLPAARLSVNANVAVADLTRAELSALGRVR